MLLLRMLLRMCVEATCLGLGEGDKASLLFLYMSVCCEHFSSASPPSLSLSCSFCISLSLNPSVTADLRPLSAGPLLVAPSWRAVSRLGRGRRQCQLYWCRKGLTRRSGPVSAAACYPPGCHNHSICPHTYHCNPNACTPASADPRQIGWWSDWDLVNWDKAFVYMLD